ncbi:fimbrial protein [Stenotrophomonas cyclobalanopsidis]|uniref:fimbrial protein n=1 Tax=Stenotrophomonas cyclobalanopsidis TaxID=2771362 RepID=UPI00346139C8
MKNAKHIAVLAALLSAGWMGSAVAAPTISFYGEVSQQTCVAQINGSTEASVLMPTVPASALATVGATAGLTPFTLSLTGCTAPSAGSVNVSTKFLGRAVTAGGHLGNTALSSPAGNVALQLTADAAGATPVVLNGITTVPGAVLASGATSTSHQYGVRYIAEGGAATPGAVLGVVEYALTYP